jgi:gas vesicle protein
MKLSDIRDLSKDDILSASGLTSKPSATERFLGGLGFFGIGLLVGAGAALLLAPKSGEDLREDLGDKLRELRNRESTSGDGAGTEHLTGPRRTEAQAAKRRTGLNEGG